MDVMQDALTWRLYLVRQILADALDPANDALPVGRMRTVLSLDQTIELLHLTVLPLPGLDVSPAQGWPLKKMLHELCVRKPALQPHKSGIERLRRIRDRVQHDGVIPSSEDVRQMRVQAEAFIRDAIREVLKKELEELSPIAMIAYEKGRSHLYKAEEALNSEDYRAAVTEAAIAFKEGWRDFNSQDMWRESWSRRLVRRLLRNLGDAATRAARWENSGLFRQFAGEFAREITGFSLESDFEELVEPIEMARYGVDIHRYARFKQITPEVYWTLNSEEPKVSAPDQWQPSQHDALLAIDFAVTTLVQLGTWSPRDERTLEASAEQR